MRVLARFMDWKSEFKCMYVHVCMYIHCFKDNMVKTFIGKLLQKIFKGNLKIRVTFVGKMLSIKSDFQLL